MGMESTREFMRRFLGELDKSLAAVDDFMSPDFRGHLPGNPEPTDRAGFKEFVAMLYAAFPDLHHQVEDQVAEDDRVATRVTARGTHRGDFQGIPPTGRKVIITDIIITRIREGKAVELWAQFDALGLLQQLGALEPTRRGENE